MTNPAPESSPQTHPDQPQPGKDPSLVARFLAGNDIACPVCGYQLTDLPAGVCPECGLALELRLALTRPRQGVYIAGLIGLGAGIGFSAMILMYFVWTSFTGGWSMSWKEVLPLLVGLGVQAPLIIVWSRSWGFFQRRRRRVGVPLAALCWVLSVAVSIWFFGWVN